MKQFYWFLFLMKSKINLLKFEPVADNPRDQEE